MVGRLELGPIGNYTKRLSREVLGIQVYRDTDKPDAGLFVAAVNLVAPAMARGMVSGMRGGDGEYLPKAFSGALVDMTTSMVAFGLGNSPEEILGYKILANIGTHAMVDAIRFGMDKISHARSHAGVS